jgi:hypothetical protein
MRRALMILTMKYLSIFSLLFVSCFTSISWANPHSAHALYGVHGMAAFKANDQYFLSHMPLSKGIHAHQVLLRITPTPEQEQLLEKLLNTKDLVSFVPEPFDLNQLIEGQLTEINGHFYTGHFERGGKPVARKFSLAVTKIWHLPVPQQGHGDYELLAIGNTHFLAVHRIGPAPSFDHIALLSCNKNTRSGTINLGQKISKKINNRLLALGCQLQRTLYLETRDFQ